MGDRWREGSNPKWINRIGGLRSDRLLGCALAGTLLSMSAKKLENRLPADHPALLAALRAPIEAETDEEREAVEAAMNSGQLVPGSMVTEKGAERERPC